jgi:hypothetical protein
MHQKTNFHELSWQFVDTFKIGLLSDTSYEDVFTVA